MATVPATQAYDNDDDELMARLDAPDAEWWRPEADDRIIGTLTGFDSVTTKHGVQQVVILDTADGLFNVGCSSVLESELFDKRDLQIGDRIAISCLGECQGRNRAYTGYKVACKPEHPRRKSQDRAGKPQGQARKADTYYDDLPPEPDYDDPPF